MRPHAPPDLRVLGDRAGLVEEADVALPLVPAAERVGHAAAREHAREDLRARRVEPAVDALDERRARREREQLRQVRAERRADADRAVGAVDPDVDVEAERVVAPDDVAEELVVAAVVRRVDDPLLLPRAPRMRSCRGEPIPSGSASARSWSRRSASSAAASANVSQRPVRISTSEAISSPTRWPSSAVPGAAACSSSKRFVRSSVSGSRSANSSSTATREIGHGFEAPRATARASPRSRASARRPRRKA